MNEDEMNYYVIKGLITDMPENQRVRVLEAAQQISEIVAKFGDEGLAALGLIGAKAAAKIA